MTYQPGDDVGEEDYEEIQETFGFCDPTPEDAPGIAAYVPRFLPWDRLQVGRIVARQDRVGTVIKNQLPDGSVGDSLFGFVSAINLGYYYNIIPAIANVVDWMKSLNNPGLNEIIANHLNTTAFFFNERAFGVPLELSPHILRSIFNEMRWATEDLPTQEERDQFKITHIIMAKKLTKDEEGLQFPTPEDEFFFEKAAIKIDLPDVQEEGDIADLEYHRFLLAVSMDVVKEVRERVNILFDVDESMYQDEELK